jgi:hypothetical protein
MVNVALNRYSESESFKNEALDIWLACRQR